MWCLLIPYAYALPLAMSSLYLKKMEQVQRSLDHTLYRADQLYYQNNICSSEWLHLEMVHKDYMKTKFCKSRLVHVRHGNLSWTTPSWCDFQQRKKWYSSCIVAYSLQVLRFNSGKLKTASLYNAMIRSSHAYSRKKKLHAVLVPWVWTLKFAWSHWRKGALQVDCVIVWIIFVTLHHHRNLSTALSVLFSHAALFMWNKQTTSI